MPHPHILSLLSSETLPTGFLTSHDCCSSLCCILHDFIGSFFQFIIHFSAICNLLLIPSTEFLISITISCSFKISVWKCFSFLLFTPNYILFLYSFKYINIFILHLCQTFPIESEAFAGLILLAFLPGILFSYIVFDFWLWAHVYGKFNLWELFGSEFRWVFQTFACPRHMGMAYLVLLYNKLLALRLFSPPR